MGRPRKYPTGRPMPRCVRCCKRYRQAGQYCRSCEKAVTDHTADDRIAAERARLDALRKPPWDPDPILHVLRDPKTGQLVTYVVMNT